MAGERERSPRRHGEPRFETRLEPAVVGTTDATPPELQNASQGGLQLAVLPFGKHRGTPIGDVPAPYLIMLCCWQLAATSSCTDPDCPCDSLRCYRVGKFREYMRGDEDWRLWLKRTHPRVVALARRHVHNHHLCHHCGTRLVPVGSARANGAAHDDWDTRALHKKCWRGILMADLEMSGSETDGSADGSADG